jgi:hypothetical protein
MARIPEKRASYSLIDSGTLAEERAPYGPVIAASSVGLGIPKQARSS